jgi:hypothetical protein
VGCASSSVSPDTRAQPSNYPLDQPVGRSGGCVISNDAEVNDHAFWDLYACCTSQDLTAIGDPFPCTAMCKTTDGQSFLDLGECLSKRVEVVICSPPFDEIGRNSTESDASSSSGGVTQSTSSIVSATVSGSGTTSGGTSASGSASASTGAANTVTGVQGSSSKAGLMIWGILALGSATGMFL